MEGPLAARQAEEILKDAYPDERERARAIKWLGWIASHLRGRRSFQLSDLPRFLPRNTLLAARALMLILACCAAYIVGAVAAPYGQALPTGMLMMAILFFVLVAFPRLWRAILFADVVLFLAWWEARRFRRLLTVALEHGILNGNALGYEFTDPRMPRYLVARCEAARSERADRRAKRAAESPVLSVVADVDQQGYWLAHFRAKFSKNVRNGLSYRPENLVARGFSEILIQVFIPLCAFLTGVLFFTADVAGLLVRAVCWVPLNWADFPRKTRAGTVAAAMAAVAVASAGAGTAAATVVVYVLPAAFVAVLGLWACILVYRAARGRNGRRWRAARHATLIAAELVTITLLINRALLTTVPALGVLFPPAVWGAFRLWRTMGGKGRSAFVKAGADIALSLAIGTELVLFLVWLANVLGMTRGEMADLRKVLSTVGGAVELQWWIWTLIYVLLAGLSLAFMLRPTRLAAVRRWFRWLRILPGANVVGRALSGIHIGLLVIVLVAAAAPAGLSPTFHRQLKTAYLVALQREFAAQGDVAAFERILRRFKMVRRGAGPDSARTVLGPLPSLVMDIHGSSTLLRGDHGATSGEADLARRLGLLQGKTLGLSAQARRSVQMAEQERARAAGMDEQAANASQLSGQIETVEAADKAADGAAEDATHVGEALVKALTSLVLGVVPLHIENEVFQIVQEYLSGLFEDGPLADAFTALAEKLPGAWVPSAQDAVIPDPGALEQAAVADAHAVPKAEAEARSLKAAVNLTGQELKNEASDAQCAECGPGSIGPGQDDKWNPPEDPWDFDLWRLVCSTVGHRRVDARCFKAFLVECGQRRRLGIGRPERFVLAGIGEVESGQLDGRFRSGMFLLISQHGALIPLQRPLPDLQDGSLQARPCLFGVLQFARDSSEQCWVGQVPCSGVAVRDPFRGV